MWNTISNIVLISALATLLVFAAAGLYQWVTRESLKKVDRELLCFPIPLVIMVIVYFLFDKVWILNIRPDGSGEPSFPSSHVMATATIFFMVAMLLPRYVKNKTTRIIFYALMLILVILVSVGRVLADKHWPVDVAGALLFAVIFTEIYGFLIKPMKKGKK